MHTEEIFVMSVFFEDLLFAIFFGNISAKKRETSYKNPISAFRPLC